jgi:hypothetical protein
MANYLVRYELGTRLTNIYIYVYIYIYIYIYTCVCVCGPGSLVGIATRYRL